MPPNRLPIVSTDSPSRTTASVPTTRATIDPGTRLTNRMNRTMTATVQAARAVAAGEMVFRLAARASMRPRNSPGTFSTVRPRKSLICVLAMRTAMPLVKPMTTGRGMYLTTDPSPVTPRRTSITPAIMVQRKSPSTP